MSETKSYVKVLMKKGVTGGTGFEAEVCVTDGTDYKIMEELIEKATKAATALMDKRFG